MSIIYSKGMSKLKFPIPHDFNEKKYYTFAYRPEIWTAGREVTEGEIVLLPSVPSGFMHECIDSGVTGGTEPTWVTNKNEITEDGTAQFKAVPSTSLLNNGDVISTSTWGFSDNPDWEAGKILDKNDTIVPTVPNGFEYDCPQGGITSNTEVVYPVVEGDTIVDGSCILVARFVGQYENDSILVNIATKLRIVKVPEDCDEINLLNKVKITRNNGDIEEYNRTIIIPVKQL